MSLPKVNLSGKEAEITMMEFRMEPGRFVEYAERGMRIKITRGGKHVATLVSAREGESDETVVNSDGSISGPVPVTLRRNLGSGGYGD